MCSDQQLSINRVVVLPMFHTDRSTADRGASPLMSNNPFRNRIGGQVSPATSPRPVSTNPFLDTTEINNMTNGSTNGVIANGSVEKTADTFVRLDLGQSDRARG